MKIGAGMTDSQATGASECVQCAVSEEGKAAAWRHTGDPLGDEAVVLRVKIQSSSCG